MARLSFSFNVPNSIYRFRLKNVLSYLKYHLSPFRCDCCDKKMPFKWFDVWGNIKGRRLGVSFSSKKILCPSCILNKLNAASENVFVSFLEDYEVSKSCDCCNEDNTAFRVLKFDDKHQDTIRMCFTAWNYEMICLDCVKTVLRDGKMSSSIYGSYKGRSVPLNGYGLPVIDGKVVFPDK